MARRDPFGSIVRWVAKRPVAVLAAVAVLALAGAALALRLEPSASTDTLVDKGSPAFEATEDFRKEFGEEPVVILVKGELQQSILTPDLGTLLRLEGCLSGNVPKDGLRTLPEVCTWFAEHQPAKVVYGPGTFINTAANQISEGFTAKQAAKAQEAEAAAEAARRLSKRRGDPPAEQERLAEQARSLVYAQFTEETLRLALRYGLTSVPSLDNIDFVSQLVFDPSRGVGQPKARFAYLFPSDNAALIQVRMKPTLSESEREEAVDRVQEAVDHEQFALERGGEYFVTGVPVVVDGLAEAVKDSIFVLLVAALLVMAATLALVFRTRLRLLPLVLALAAAALTFGAVSLAGGSLTMASIAALPVLIGLAVDYCIQFQARFEEVESDGRGPARTRRQRGGRGERRRPDDRDGGPLNGGRLPRAAALAGADGARVRRAARDRHLRRARLRAHGGLRGADPVLRAAARRPAGPAAGARPRGRLVGCGRHQRRRNPPGAGSAAGSPVGAAGRWTSRSCDRGGS